MTTQTPAPNDALVPTQNPGAVAAQAAAFSMNDPGADAQQAQANQSSAALARISSPPPGSSDVWVTVPVDKVSVTSQGRGMVQPMYAAGEGYKEGAANGLPPTVGVGRTTR